MKAIKLKTTIVTAFLLLFITSISFAQRVQPPFLSEARAIQDFKKDTDLMNNLKKSYGIVPSELHFKKYKGWKLLYSRELSNYKNRFDEDVCEMIFTTTVVKGSFTYLFYWYASYNCALVTDKNVYYKDKWTYNTKNSEYSFHTLTGGKKSVSDQGRIAFLTNILNKCEGETELTIAKHGITGSLSGLKNFIEFKGVTIDDEEDVWLTTTKKEWHLRVNGVAAYRGNHNVPEIITKLGENAWASVEITVEKDKTGKWIPIKISSSTQYNSPVKYEGTDYYSYGEKTYKELINNRYKKGPSIKNTQYKTKKAKQLEDAFLMLKELKYEEFISAMKLLVYKADEDIINSYVNIYQYPYKRLCNVKFSTNKNTYYSNNDTDKPRTKIRWSVERKSARDDKKLAKYYKENGMNKALFKAGKTHFRKSYEQKLEMEFIDGEWWITKPALTMEIPF